MSSRLPILAGLILALGVALMPDHLLDSGLALLLPSRRPDRGVQSKPSPQRPREETKVDDVEAVADSPASGQQLMARAIQSVFGYESLTARIRLRVHLFEQNLTGTGRYFQLGPNEDKLLRLDLKIRTLDGETRLQQICDGRNLWLFRDAPSISRRSQPRATISRVDLRHVHEVVGSSDGSATDLFAPGRMVEGGLAYLLKELDANFDFQDVDVSTLSGVPMWTLRGRWKPERVAQVRPEGKNGGRAGKSASLDSLPAPLPHQVVVVLAQHDLFPFQIQYLRWEDRDRSRPSAGKLEPIVTMELFEVATEDAIDPRLFQFQPPTDLEVDDQTGDYLARLGVRSAM